MIVLCSAGLLASGCSNSPKPDSLVIQGAWKGQEVRGDPQGVASLVLEGTKLEFRGANTNEWYKATFLLREETNPKQLEAVVIECPFPKYVGKSVHGIYKLEDGKLTFAAHEPGNPTVPTSYDAKGAREFIFTQK